MSKAAYCFKAQALQGNCGMEFYSFGNNSNPPKFQWSWEEVARILGKARGPDSLIAFSGNSSQKTWSAGPHTFADWLIEQKEKVHCSPWTTNFNTRNKIRSYFWVPSKEARKAIAKAQVDMKTESDLYHSGHNNYSY